MKKLLTLVMLLCLLAACGENNAEDTQVAETAAATTDPVEPAEVEPEAHTEDNSIVPDEEEESEEIMDLTVLEDYTVFTSRDQLIAAFEEELLVHGESWFAEGTVRYDNTMLTNPYSGDMIFFLWDENGNISSIQADCYVYDQDFDLISVQEVASSTGVFTGMSLAELKDWNEADFDFMGMGWDYEGSIIAEPGSRLANNPIQIKLTFDQEIDLPDEYNCLYGDVVLNTADAEVAGAPVLVGSLTWRPEED